MKSPERVVL